MRYLLTVFAISALLFGAPLSHAQTPPLDVTRGGTGTTTVPNGWFLVGSSTLRLTAQQFIDLAADVTGILPATNGGLGVDFSGAASGIMTWVNALAQPVITSTFSGLGTVLSGELAVADGGTGVNTFTASQLLYGNGTNALSSTATSSLAVGTGLTSSGTLGYQVGGTNSSISFAPIAANTLWANGTGASAVPTAIATSTLYGAASTGGYVLQWSNTANGLVLAATSTSAGGTPGGSDTQVQFNNAGAFGGDAGFTWNSALARLTATYASTTNLSVTGTASSTFAGPIVLSPNNHIVAHGIQGDGSDGFHIDSSASGPVVALFGAGGGTGTTFYGGVNIDGTTRLATALSGFLKATSGTVSAVSSLVPTDLSLTKGYFVVGDDAGVAQATSTIFISSTGSVGIGSTSPYAKLAVQGSSDVRQFVVKGNGTQTSNLAEFQNSSGTNVFTISNTGLLNSRVNLTNTSIQHTNNNSNLTLGGVTIAESNSKDIVLTPFTNGKVGIGTSSPQSLLHIANGFSGGLATDTTGLTIENSASTYLNFQVPLANTSGIIWGSPGDPSAAQISYGLGADLMTIGTNNNGGDIAFIVGNGGEVVRILDSGYVGIGATAPITRLEVVGAPISTKGSARLAQSQGNSATAPTTISTGTYLQLGGQEYGANSYRLIGFGYNQSVAPASLGYLETDASGGTKGALVFNTRDVTTSAEPTERLRITSDGLVGIGSTSPTYKLSVEGTSSLGNEARAGYFTATTTATSTFAGGIQGVTGYFTTLLESVNTIVTTILRIPYGASPTVATNGDIGIDSTANQFKFFSGGAVKVLGDGNLYPAFTYSTTTAWTGTTTIPLGTAYVGETWNGVQCFTDAGTLGVSFYDGTNRMSYVPTASTTVNTNALTTNNTFTAQEKRYVDVGTPASSPTKISCTVSKSLTAD